MDEKYLPLFAMGAGLLGNGQPGQRPTFASGLGQGLLGGLQGMQMMQQVGDDKRQRRLQELQLSLASIRAQKESAKEAAQQMAMAQLGQGKSPEQQALLAAAPDAAIAAFTKQMFPEQMTPFQEASIGMDREQLAQSAALQQQRLEMDRLQFEASQGNQAAQLELQRQRLNQGPDPLEADRLALQREEFEWKRQNGGGGAASPLARLLAERNALAPDDPNRAAYDAAIAKDTTRGDGIRVRPDGTVEIGGDNDATTSAGKNKISQYRAARDTMNAAITDYKDLVDKTGGSILPGTAEEAALKGAQTRVMMGAKNVYDLGAPTGPDIELLNNMIPDVTKFGGIINPTGRVKEGISALEKDVERMTTDIERGYGGESSVTPAAAPAAAQAAGSPGIPKISGDADYNALPSGATFMAPDGSTRRKP